MTLQFTNNQLCNNYNLINNIRFKDGQNLYVTRKEEALLFSPFPVLTVYFPAKK